LIYGLSFLSSPCLSISTRVLSYFILTSNSFPNSAIYDKLDYSIADVESAAGGKIALSADKVRLVLLLSFFLSFFGEERRVGRVGRGSKRVGSVREWLVCRSARGKER
jgi:hypothetical protein